MSVFDKIGEAFSEAFRVVSHPIESLEWIWNQVKWVWWFLKAVASVVSGAWNWMVNGVEWFSGEVSRWAGEAWGLFHHILFSVIPGAIAWLARTIFGMVKSWFLKVWGFVEHTARSIYGWAIRELGKLAHLIKVVIGEAIKWVEAAVHFVARWGGWILKLLTHPENIVKWILSSLVGPLVQWILRSGAPIIVWLLRQASRESSDLAHLFEDVLSDMF